MGRQGGRAEAADLLVLTEGEVNGATRGPAAREQVLGRLELGHQHVLDVERAAPPDPLVVDVAGEGPVEPLALGPGDDRHDVLVGDELDGIEVGLGAGDRDEHRVPHEQAAS